MAGTRGGLAPRADVTLHADCAGRGITFYLIMLGGVVTEVRKRVPRHLQGGHAEAVSL